MKKIAMLLMPLVCLCLAADGRAEIDMVVRETFEGVNELSSQNPGNLGAWVSGAWQCRPVGPRRPSVAEPGWSGDAQGSFVRTFWNLHQSPYNTARECGMIGAWVRFESLASAGYFGDPTSANPAMVLMLTSGGDNAPFQMIGVTAAGLWASRTVNGWWQASGPVLLKAWYWVQIEWENSTSGLSAIASCQILGGDMVELGTQTYINPGYQANAAHIMNAPFQDAPYQHYTWRGRLGGATLARIGFIGEGRPLPDLLPPVEQPHVWYLNPASGSDTNDGLAPGRAWKSVEKFNLESANAGLLSPLNGGYQQGDCVVVDTSLAPLELGSEQLKVQTSGLTLRPPAESASVKIQAHKDISAPGTVWMQINSQQYPHVWVSTDGQASDLRDVVVWENDLWLNHPTGATATSVLDQLNATPGSFYSDGERLYLHPFASTNPNTDGKTYTRSRFRIEGGSAVMLLAGDLRIKGIDVRKTCLARSIDGDSYTAYGIQGEGGEGGFGGTILLEDCYTDYVGKHGIGFTDSNSNRDLTLVRCQVEQGSPYFNQTPFVDYNGNNDAVGNRTTYINCTNLKVAGEIGSKDGQSTLLQSYYLHNNGVGLQFDHIRFQNCVFGGQITVSTGVRALTMDQTKFGGGEIYAQESLITRCVMDQLPVGGGLPTGRLTAQNNLCVFSQAVFNGSYNVSLQGTVIYEGNTFDLRPYLRTDNGRFALFDRTGTLNFTFRNNIFISPSDREFTVIENAYDSDTFNFSRNLYQTSTQQFLISRFNSGGILQDLQLSQWQALGYDQGSQGIDPQLDDFYVPTANSPATHAGADLGLLEDYSGRLFSQRLSIGALEPRETFSEWRARQFNQAELAQETISGPAADADWDGRPNLLEFALGGCPKESLTSLPITMERSLLDSNMILLKARKSTLVRGIRLQPEFSTDLLHWQDVSEMDIESQPDPLWIGTSTLVFHGTLGASQTSMFWRLNVTLVDPPP